MPRHIIHLLDDACSCLRRDAFIYYEVRYYGAQAGVSLRLRRCRHRHAHCRVLARRRGFCRLPRRAVEYLMVTLPDIMMIFLCCGIST